MPGDFQQPSDPPVRSTECSASGKRVESEVDMWDEPNGSENTVSNRVRRYTSQWGLPQMRPTAEGKTPNDPSSATACKCQPDRKETDQ